MSFASTVRLPFAAAALVALAPGLPARQDPAARALVVRALDRMGGESRVRALHTLRFVSFSTFLGVGQEPGAGEPPPMNQRSNTMMLDFDAGRAASDAEFPGVGTAGQPFRQHLVQTREGGMADNNGAYQPLPAAPEAGPTAVRLYPSRLLLAALEPATTLTAVPDRRTAGGVEHGAKMVTALDTLTLWFDATGRLSASETVADDPVLGDRITRTTYHGWAPVGRDGLRLPLRIDAAVNGQVNLMTAYAAMTADAALADSTFAMPDSMLAKSRALGSPTAPPVIVRMDSLAPGVFHLTGGSHHSLAIVQGDSIILVEVPLSSARVRAMLDTLASRLPQAPVRLAVNTHHHWDHAGGVRAAFGARLPVLTQTANVAFLRRIGATRHSLAPDDVERLRHDVRGVDDSLAIGTGANRVVLFRLPSTHDDAMLAAWVPDAKVLFVADLLPNTQALPAREVTDFATAHRLDVQRIAPAHGAVMAWTAVEQLARQ